MKSIKVNSIIVSLILTAILTGFSNPVEISNHTSTDGNPPIVFSEGDIVIGGPDGQIEWITKASNYCFSQSSSIRQMIGTAAIGKRVLSMAFDNSVNLYASIRTPSPFFGTFRIDRFNIDGTFGETITQFPGLPIFPESIVFDTQNNFYLGTYVGILKNNIGPLIYEGYVAGLDLYCDQSTFLFTTAGTFIKKYSNNTSTIFAQNLGGIADDVRILPSGQVLLANDLNILLIKADGSAIDRTYSPPGTGWRSLAIESDAKHFICGSYRGNDIYRFNIENGNSEIALTGTFNTFCMAIVEGYTAASTGNNCGGIATKLDISPLFSINPINTEDCITATVTDVCGMPVTGATVEMRVAGANQSVITGTTNLSGQFQGCYPGLNIGVDQIIAEVRNSTCSSYPTAIACKVWDSPLPVELTSFSSFVDHSNVSLTWTTSSETNNSGFSIERKDAVRKWASVGFVKGIGNSTTQNNYGFIDKNLISGNYNYRLKQTDFNGNYEYFNLSNEVIVGVPTMFELSQNFPNPFNPSTKIEYQLPNDGNVSISVYDNSGREVKSLVNEFNVAGYYSVNFNASSLSSGVYYYKLTAGSFNAVKKMLLVK